MSASQQQQVSRERARRIQWWQDGRFGMFIHWGLYAQLGRAEWVMNREKTPWAQYDRLADTWAPKPGFAREWAKLARRAGMKYLVLTTKHHDGFCLWNTAQTDFNAARRGPGRDLIAEYADACRREGMRVGLYYSIMDWHHPDGERCAKNEAARRRFVDFTHGCVRELMTNYGKIDVLWYDAGFPLSTPEMLESVRLNAMARELQPGILINDRAHTIEDFANSEAHISASTDGRPWEACMTFNGEWGYAAHRPPEDWLTVRQVLGMLRQVTLAGGNLLLNIGPKADGSVPSEATERLLAVGRWLGTYGEAVYGRRKPLPKGRNLEWLTIGHWTRQGNTAYLWVDRWAGPEIVLACFRSPVLRASLLGSGKPLRVRKEGERTILSGLPRSCPDRVAGIPVVKVECASTPHQWCGMFGPAVKPR